MKKALLLIGLACGLGLTALGHPGQTWKNVTIYVQGEKVTADIEDTGVPDIAGDYLSATCTCADGSIHKAVGHSLGGNPPFDTYWEWDAEIGFPTN